MPQPHEVIEQRMGEFGNKFFSENRTVLRDEFDSFNLHTATLLLESYIEMVGEDEELPKYGTISDDDYSKIEGRNEERSRLRSLLTSELEKIKKLQ